MERVHAPHWDGYMLVSVDHLYQDIGSEKMIYHYANLVHVNGNWS